MEKTELVEIKKGSVGNGLLIENDGYISMSEGNNKQIKESIENSDGWHCPSPFIVDAVFQKYGIKNANGRIYPENVLRKQVELYQQKINEKRALGECYTPDVMVLSKKGWVTMESLKEGDEVLTLNTKNNNIEIQKIEKKIEYDFNDDMIRIKGKGINDLVTPNHGYAIYNRNHNFKGFYTANEILSKEISDQSHSYIPKNGTWTEPGDEYFILEKCENLTAREIKLHPDSINDKKILMSTFMKFLGIYLSEGDFRKNNNDVNIYQKKENICNEINNMLIELDLKFTINTRKNGCKIFRISDPRLHKFVSNLGDCYSKYIPFYFKNQSKENLRIFYDWFVMGDGRIRGDKRYNKKNMSDDIFSVSKQLVLDLNEVQFKIGYNGTIHTDERNYDRKIGDRIIKKENSNPMYFSYRSLSKGVYLDDRFLNVSKEHYEGKVMCIEVKNHTFFVMSNGFTHWSKNCNHPAESTIDLGRISHNIIELHWEGRTLVGKMEINLSRGYVKYGICSTLGDTVANLLLNGYKIGVSSRGVGSVEQDRMGQYIVGDDFELICWDIVGDPSTPNAWIGHKEELQQYVEHKNNNKTILSNKIDKIKNLL